MAVNVLVSCGSGLVTSTLVANELMTIAEENHLDIKITKVGMTGIEGFLPGTDILISTGGYDVDTQGVPVMASNPLISGIGEEEFKKEFIELVKAVKN